MEWNALLLLGAQCADSEWPPFRSCDGLRYRSSMDRCVGARLAHSRLSRYPRHRGLNRVPDRPLGAAHDLVQPRLALGGSPGRDWTHYS